MVDADRQGVFHREDFHGVILLVKAILVNPSGYKILLIFLSVFPSSISEYLALRKASLVRHFGIIFNPKAKI